MCSATSLPLYANTTEFKEVLTESTIDIANCDYHLRNSTLSELFVCLALNWPLSWKISRKNLEFNIRISNFSPMKFLKAFIGFALLLFTFATLIVGTMRTTAQRNVVVTSSKDVNVAYNLPLSKKIIPNRD